MTTPYDLIGKFLSGEATVSEAEELMNWRKEDPKNEEEYLLVLATWGHSFNEIDQFEKVKEEAFEEVQATINQTKGGRSFSLYMLTGVAAMLLMALGIVYFSGILETESPEMISVNSGGLKKEIALPDGTKVLLNKASEISYRKNFEGAVRDVSFKGEAYFEVAKNPNKPFVIKAGNSKTRVLGTAFNLNTTNEESIQIIVTEGQVQFSDLAEQQKEFLQVGEKAELKTASLKIVKEKVTDENAMAWKTGKLKFNQTKLADAVKLLNDYYGVSITYERELAAYPVTFTIDQKSLEYTIELMKNFNEFNVVNQGKTYHITR